MPASPKVGEEFAGHKLESVIGRGGMGVVYLAENQRLKRKIALKLLPPELVEDNDFRERFSRESQMAAAIEHPNIVPIYEAGEVEGLLYISMRYVPGSDLKTLIDKEGPLSLERTVHLLDQVASALDDAHERDLIHRDVKPQNILVQKRAGRRGGEQAYLTDFGLTKQRGSKTMTQAGSIVGTIDYMSPEALGAKEVDARADIYSLGCVLYECLTGSVPFAKESDVAAITAHLYEEPPRLSAVRQDLPGDLDYVIGSALAKNADDRYATAGELLEVAHQVMEAQPSFSEEAYGGGAAAAQNWESGETDQWTQGQWVDQGWDTSQTWQGAQQTSDPTQAASWGQQTSDPTAQQNWGTQQTSDPNAQSWGGQQTSDPNQTWGGQQTSDPNQGTWAPQQTSDPNAQSWGGQWSDPNQGTWGAPQREKKALPVPLPVLIGGGVGLLVLIVVLVLVLGGGGGDEPENGGGVAVQSNFAPRSTTEFTGDAASLLPQSIAGLTLDSQNPNFVECAPGETSKANGAYIESATGDAGGGGIEPASFQEAGVFSDINICLYATAPEAETDLSNSITTLEGDGFTVSQRDEPLVDQQGQEVGTLTIMTNSDKQANEFEEVFLWSNNNLSGFVGGSNADLADQVFADLSF